MHSVKLGLRGLNYFHAYTRETTWMGRAITRRINKLKSHRSDNFDYDVHVLPAQIKVDMSTTRI